LADRFPAWWLPDSVEFVDELPKTSVGKIDKKELRRRAAGGATPSTSAATTG
jgi:fatty-acyl-CoA synthase